jgi:hypothetical protein
MACWDYEKLFRKRARELTMLALAGSEQQVQAEIRRAGDPAALTAMFNSLAKVRKLLVEYGEQAQMYDAYDKLDAAKAERARLAAQYPVLADPKLDIHELSAAHPGALAAVVRRVANERLDDIRKTRTRVNKDEDVVLQLDRVVELTHMELGAGPGSVGQKIVQARKAKLDNDESFRSFSLAVLAIGLGMLTFGTGSVALLAGAGSLGVGIFQAHDEWEKYLDASAAAHTAFDPAQSVSSRDPTVLRLVVALVGVGIEGAGEEQVVREPRRSHDPRAHRHARLSRRQDRRPQVRGLPRDAQGAQGVREGDRRRRAGAVAEAGVEAVLQRRGGQVRRRPAGHQGPVGQGAVQHALLRRRDAAGRQADVRREAQRGHRATRPHPCGPRARSRTRRARHRQRGVDERHRKSANPGMSGIWASDEAMLKSAQTALAMRKAGLGTFNNATGTWTVDFAELPHAGRAFVVSHRVPATAKPINLDPFPGIPVAELPVNNVRAYISAGNPPEIVSIFPSWVPNPKPRPLNLDVDVTPAR